MSRWLPSLLLCLLVLPLESIASVQLQEGAETLGDLRPMVIRVDNRPLPDIDLEDAVERYVTVFEAMSDPETRIDVLNRIQNLQSRFGDNLGLSEAETKRLHREALPDFETLLAGDARSEERDRLLYEAARASDIAGEPSSSIDYLETLMAEHPDSELVPESAFRVGEYRFSGGEHAAAVKAFRKALETSEKADFRERVTYMLGWSQFLDDRHEAASDTFVGFLDNHYRQDTAFGHLSGKAREQVDDGMRVLGLIAAYDGGPKAMAGIIDRHGGLPYEAQLFHRLTRFYRDNSRYGDSVDTARFFRERNPAHDAAPMMATEIVRSWSAGGYTDKARDAKAAFVEEYGDEQGIEELDEKRRTQLMTFLKELGVWQYRQGQAGADKAGKAFDRASRYLEQWADHHARFPTGNRFETPGLMLLLAGDASQQAGDSDRAIQLYQRAAYGSAPFPAAREAGYALVQMRHDRWQGQDDGNESVLDQLVADTERFITTFQHSPRIPSVRHKLANILYDNDRLDHAERVARALVESGGGDRHERAGWIVIGHVALERGGYARAEKAWNEALALTPENDERRADFTRRLAVSVYRQGEAAQEAGDKEEALRHFERVSRVAPETDTAISAEFDYAGLLLELERWDEAISALSAFRERYPDHRLTQRISERLVFAHLESGDPGRAADEMMAREPEDLSGKELWEYRLEAAGHYREAGRRKDAASLYESFLAEGARHLGGHEFHQERRHDLIELHAELDRGEEQADWHQRLLEAEREESGTSRSEYLASQSALWLGQRATEDFEAIHLGAPIKESLPRKRDAMETAVDYFQQAEKFGFAETATESTYHLAELYRQLAEDVMDSDRPKGLTDLEADQYEMLLEEQTYPFEEKAIELHKRNQKRIADGHWTPWVSRSLSTLAEMVPARYQRESLWMEARNESVR